MAITGTFVKIDPVPTRKVVRLHIELPIEHANKVISELGGYPDPANAKHVAIALLDEKAFKPDNTLKGGKLAQRAGILCNEGGFITFAKQRGFNSPESMIYQLCGTDSRANLDHDQEAANAFKELNTEYSVWLKDAA